MIVAAVGKTAANQFQEIAGASSALCREPLRFHPTTSLFTKLRFQTG
jgi:hypothetical protein